MSYLISVTVYCRTQLDKIRSVQKPDVFPPGLPDFFNTVKNSPASLGVWSLLTPDDIWFKGNLPPKFVPSINLCIDLKPFSKCFRVPFSRTLRSPRSNNLEIQKDENSKWKLIKTRWNPKFGLGDLENDLLTSMTSEEAEWIFSKIIFLKSVHQAEKNEL